MTAEFREKVDEAVKFWKDEADNRLLLSLLCEYSRETVYDRNDPKRKEEHEVNIWALQKVLLKRMEESK